MRKILRYYVHTAAFDGEAGVERIRSWHKARGWSDIGYHVVIGMDGHYEEGRPVERPGAGVKGDNRFSIHYCCEGHGDLHDFTPAQKKTLVRAIADDIQAFGNVERFKQNPSIIRGHREINGLIQFVEWLTKAHRTTKTCPGIQVDMTELRKAVIQEGRSRGWYKET